MTLSLGLTKNNINSTAANRNSVNFGSGPNRSAVRILEAFEEQVEVGVSPRRQNSRDVQNRDEISYPVGKSASRYW